MVSIYNNDNDDSQEASAPLPEKETIDREYWLSRSAVAANFWLQRKNIKLQHERELKEEQNRHEEELKAQEQNHIIAKITERNELFHIITWVSGVTIALVSIIFGILQSHIHSTEKEAKQAQAEAEVTIAALENGYEQVNEVTETHWFRADDRVTLWKKKDGTSYSGDLKAEKKDLQPKR